MLKKIVLVLALIVLPMAVFAETAINSDHWTYKDIKSLIDAGVITKSLDKDTLTRAEVVEYINDGVHNVLAAKSEGSSGSSTKELAKQIDKLYSLVKAYMDDMAKSQQSLNDILNTIGDLRVKKAELEKKQDKLLSSLGMRINGESSAYMTDLLLSGDNYTPASRVRPITQYLDMMFSLHASKIIYAEATFRMENFYGGYWGSYDIVGLKRFFIQGDMPVAFVFGDFQGRLTPFTIWSVDESRPFESKLYADKREMNKKELNLLDNAWPLNGAKAQTIVSIFDAVDLDVQVIGARLQEAANGSAKPADIKVYNTAADVYNIVSYNHDQYMVAGRLESDFYLNKLLKDIAEVEIGVNYLDILDVKDTGSAGAPSLENTVASADLKVKALGDMLKVSGEFAMSSFTGDKGVVEPLTDIGMKADVEFKAFNTTLKGSYVSNGRDFTAYAAQSRIYNEADNISNGQNPLYLTQNSTWNMQRKPPGYEVGGHQYPFTQYNPQIVVNYSGTAGHYGNLLAYPVYENNLMPYGDASPDRSGILAELSGSYLEDMIQPAVKFGMMTEAAGYRRDITAIEAGSKFNWWMFSLSAGYRMETTAIPANAIMGSPTSQFDSSIIDAGLEFTPIKKKLVIYAGFKNIDFSGDEAVLGDGTVSAGMYPVLQPLDATAMSFGGGIEYRIAKPALIGVSYTTTTITDDEAGTVDTAQEIDARVSINF